MDSRTFRQGFDHLQAWANQHGHSRVSQKTVVAGGFALGRWAAECRTAWRREALCAQQIGDLESLPGWIWDPRAAQFNLGLRHLQVWVRKHGHARVPGQERSDDGFRLGAWVNSRRNDHRIGRLSPARTVELEKLPGWVWNPTAHQFEQGIDHLQMWVREHGHTRVPQAEVCGDGFALGWWVTSRRADKRRGELIPDRIARLDALPGWGWEVFDDQFRDGYVRLVRWTKRRGHARIPRDLVLSSGFRLGDWVHNRRAEYRRGTLLPERIAQLERVPGWAWNARHERSVNL